MPWILALPASRSMPVLGHIGNLSQPLQDWVPPTSKLTTASGHPGTCNQRLQDLVPHISMLALAQGNPEPWQCPPAGWHQLQEPQSHKASHPGIQFHSPVGLGSPRHCSQLCQQQSHASTGWHQIQESRQQPPTLRLSSAYQWASTNPGTSRDSAANCLLTLSYSPVDGGFCTRYGLVTTEPADNHYYLTAYTSQPAKQKNFHSPRKNIALVTREECTACMHRTSTKM